MLVLIPFISFDGDCEEAINYYKEKLNGEISGMMRFKDGPMEVSEDKKNNVMYVEFTFDEGAFMASDTMGEKSLNEGNNVSLSVGLKDLEKTETYFNNLAEEGTVNMPLQDTFWGARFGSLTDKYGINWMFNCELPQSS